MTPADPKLRLTRLVELAGRDGPASRRALVGELTDLLLDWPQTYPANMREPFEALLERAVRGVDPEARALLAERLAVTSDMPLPILNLLVFDAAPTARDAILAQNAGFGEDGIRVGVNEPALLAAVRKTEPFSIPAILASRFRIPDDIAAQIAADSSAFSLAVLCKGARVSRAAFSALSLMLAPGAAQQEIYRRLAAYDGIVEDCAAGLVAFWRAKAPREADSKAA